MNEVPIKLNEEIVFIEWRKSNFTWYDNSCFTEAQESHLVDIPGESMSMILVGNPKIFLRDHPEKDESEVVYARKVKLIILQERLADKKAPVFVFGKKEQIMVLIERFADNLPRPYRIRVELMKPERLSNGCYLIKDRVVQEDVESFTLRTFEETVQ